MFNFIIKERNATLWWKIYSSRTTPSINISSLSHRQWLFSLKIHNKKKKRKKCFNFIIKGTSRFDKNLCIYYVKFKKFTCKEKERSFPLKLAKWRGLETISQNERRLYQIKIYEEIKNQSNLPILSKNDKNSIYKIKKKMKILNQNLSFFPHRYLFALHLLPRIPIWEFKNKRLCKRILASPLPVQLFLNFEFSSWTITRSSAFHERKIKRYFFLSPLGLRVVSSRNNSRLIRRTIPINENRNIVDVRIKENSATTDDTVVRNFEKKSDRLKFQYPSFHFFVKARNVSKLFGTARTLSVQHWSIRHSKSKFESIDRSTNGIGARWRATPWL